MNAEQDSGSSTPQHQAKRKSERVSLTAMVKLRRRGRHSFMVKVFDLSPEGCKLEFQERPQLQETVWLKFDRLEGLEARVCWIEGLFAGVEFIRPIYKPVFEHIVRRLSYNWRRG